MTGYDDDDDEFDFLLDEIERAADSLDRREVFDPLDIIGASLFDMSTADDVPPTLLREQPQSLVDLRVLSSDHPLSHDRPAKAPSNAAPTVGAVVDHKYEILDEARGTANGFEVKHVVLRQKFILQLLSPRVVDDPVMWPKFQNDIRAAGLLGHEHLEFVTDLGRCSTYGAYLIKQWIEGPTLEEYLEDQGFRSLNEAVQFAHAVGGAIAALHEVGVIHGRLSARSVRRVQGVDGPSWKVLDVCTPGGDDLLVAPEQMDGGSTTPAADQYAVALLTWQMIVGGDNIAADAIVAGIAPVATVLRVAMAEDPSQRYSDMLTMLKALLDAAPSTPEPSVDPLDRREATRNVQRQLEAAPPAPAPSHPFSDRPRSMVVSLDRTTTTPRIAVEFATKARLRREYRRNILAGGLFVPTPEMLPLGGAVRVELRFPLSAAAVQVDASVVSFDEGSATRPRGYGVAFDAGARGAIENFIASLEVPDVSADSKLVVLRKLDTSAAIGAGEAFLLSRLGAGTTPAGSARAMFSGLPYDFDACLATLLEGGWIGVEPSAVKTAAPAAAPAPAPTPQPEPSPSARPVAAPEAIGSHEWNDVARVLETIDYFEEQGNFMAASRVLESAAQNAPDVAVYLHRLGLLRARFDIDLDAARTAIRRARAIAPRDEENRASERYVATLVEISAVRTLWEHDFADEGTAPRWVRSEPELGRVWLALDARATLIEVDYRAPRVEREVRSGHVVIPQNSPEFDALEHRKEVDTRSGAKRHERQVEIARRFGKMGPHFARPPAPVATSTNATITAVLDAGLVVLRPESEPLRLGTGDVHAPRFSPDDHALAWLVREPGDRWTLHISPVAGPDARRASFDTRPSLAWTDDSAGIVALERRPGRLRYFDRRPGNDRILSEFPGFVDLALVTCSDGLSALVVGRRVIGEKSWIARWVDLRNGEKLGEFVMPDGVTDGLLRPDGKLAATLRDGRLFLADFAAGNQKTVSSVSPCAGTLRGSWWRPGSALVIVEIVDTTARVLSVDVDLLCG